MALTGSLTVISQWNQTPTNVPGALPVQTNLPLTWTVKSGTAADQAENKYAWAGTIPASTPMVIDLTALTDYQGNAITCARIKSITIVNLATTATWVLKIGYTSTTSNAHTGFLSNPGQITLGPSTAATPASITLVAPDATGYPVNSTNKLIPLDPGSHAIPVQIEITTVSV